MARRRFYILIATSLVCCAGVLAYSMHQNASGEEAIAYAEHLLATPFDDAPELHDLPLPEITAALGRAQEHGVRPEHGLQQEVAALEYLLAGDLIFAHGSLDEARQTDGWTCRRRIMAAALARANADVDGAWEHIREAAALEPDSGRALLVTADLALDRQDLRAATSSIRRLAITHPRVAVVQNRLGLVLELAGDMEGALAAFTRATELDPALHVAWINRARRARASGDLEAARSAFERATALQSGDADAWLGLGLATLDLGELDVAAEALERADELASHDAAPQLALGDLATAEGRHEDAIDAYREALRRREDAAESWVKLGNALVRTQQDGAEAAYREAIRIDPELAAAHNGLGASLSRAGDFEAAAEALLRAAEIDEVDPNPWMNLALVREAQGALEDARNAWRAAIERDPDASVAHARLARLDG